MLQLLIGSFLLSVVHAAIPNHWLPIIAISKTEKWSGGDTLLVTAVVGIAHTVSTIVIGIVVGYVSYRLSSSLEIAMKIAAPLILIILGVIYMLIDFGNSSQEHRHAGLNVNGNRSKKRIIVTLGIAMLFSPCLEIEAYYVQAGRHGWPGITLVSLVYLVITVLGMMVLVKFGRSGLDRIKWDILEHHEKTVTGIVLIVVGIVAYFV